MLVAPEVRDLGILADHLAGWLQQRMPEARGIRLHDLSYPSGAGQSHETILFDMEWFETGRHMTQGCVVRIKPLRHTVFPDDLFDQQYRLMSTLHEHGRVRVAHPLWFEPDPVLLGAPFFVMEKKHGRVAVSFPPYAQVGWVAEATPAQRSKMWENGVRELAVIQSTPLSSLDFLRGPDSASSGLAQEWDKFERFLAWVSKHRRWPSLEAGLARLQREWPKNQPAGLVWGDARLGNLMFDANFDVVAVMDWEQPSLGGALHDLAWWLSIAQLMHCGADGKPMLAGFGTREETITVWQDLTGISAADIEWYEEFTAFKIACLEIRTSGLRGRPLPSDAALAKRLKV